MARKNFFFILVALALACGPVWGQAVHHNDDRDLFIGVGGGSSILPNIMIMADNSGSMNSAIYHPAYNPKIDYKLDGVGTHLTLTETLPNMTNWWFDDTSIRYMDYFNAATEVTTTPFKICRGTPEYSYSYDARGTFSSQITPTPRRWKVYKSSFRTVTGVLYTPVENQIVDYKISSNIVGATTRIITVSSGQDTSWPYAQYWILEVDMAWEGPPAADQNPDANAYIYINYHQALDYSDSPSAKFVPSADSCSGYANSVVAALYGGQDDGNKTRYDENYLYWLAFHASAAQIAQVQVWASTGAFPDGNGVLVDFGYFRMEVLRRVLGDVIREVHEDVNVGIACFNSDNHGGYIRENLTNVTAENLDEMIKTNIDNLYGTTNTPLAETLADVWFYMIGQNTSTLQPHTDKSVANDCPLENYCQKNYVILMTDGESTQDELVSDGDDRFYDSYFATHPVKRTATEGWGDADDNEPKPAGYDPDDPAAYCPNNSCWGSNGTDYLDDVAYYMANIDHFPDSIFDPCYGLEEGSAELAACIAGKKIEYETFLEKYQGAQTIETYVIGFNMDNDMLAETAENGNGEYYTANSYAELKSALVNAIVSIQLRNMAFAAFTAPKKITSTVGEGYSFIGYFMPEALSGIWTGHLQSFLMIDRWYADLDGSGSLEKENDDGDDEYVNGHIYQDQCLTANPGLNCLRSVDLADTPKWDTQQEIHDSTTDRSLFTNESTSPYALIDFSAANIDTLKPLLGAADDLEAGSIISTIGGKTLGDIFHSDIAYVGPPMQGKQYIRNLNPVDCGDVSPIEDDTDCFQNLLTTQAARDKVLYVGSNDGILHQVDAVTGEERWGFIPDEVLLNLKKIVVNKEYTYTVDGRLLADDIYYRGATRSWKTLLVFGLKDGGSSFYCLDITNAGSNPAVLWKFKDNVYSGMSWSKPYIGKVRLLESGVYVDRWVVIVAGGMAFNNEYNGSSAGKAIFVIDASSGNLIWMIGYNSSGAADNAGTVPIDTNSGDGLHYLTAKPEFNYPIPSAITPVDRDSDGFFDTIYFGNVAGHLFKTDISAAAPADWKTYQLFKKDNSVPQASTTISSIDAANTKLITVVNASNFDVHKNVFGLTSKAMGTIDFVDKKVLTVSTISPSSFTAGETLVVPSFDPIFLSPAVFFDPGYNLWVAFGSGDRIRSRTNPDTGKFYALRDGSTLVSGSQAQKTDILLADLVPITWTGTVINPTDINVADKWGWWFTFPMFANHEKLFDPDPLVLPDLNLVPHLYFNTYQPSLESTYEECDAPKNGLMYFYDLKMDFSGTGTLGGSFESGRIAGGGVFQGSDYIVYVGQGDVASIPPLQDIKPLKLIYTGSMLFMKEKKR